MDHGPDFVEHVLLPALEFYGVKPRASVHRRLFFIPAVWRHSDRYTVMINARGRWQDCERPQDAGGFAELNYHLSKRAAEDLVGRARARQTS